MKYKDIYQKVYSVYPGDYGKNRLNRGFVVLNYFDPCNVLDVGCGQGVFMREAIKRGFDAQGMDIASGVGISHDVSKTFPMPDNSFDLAVSFDMLEHLTVADAKFALSEMARVAKKMAIQTGHKSCKVKNVELHLIQKPVEWWITFIEKSTGLKHQITLDGECMVFTQDED